MDDAAAPAAVVAVAAFANDCDLSPRLAVSWPVAAAVVGHDSRRGLPQLHANAIPGCIILATMMADGDDG